MLWGRRLDDHIKVCDERYKLIDSTLTQIKTEGAERHAENLTRLNALKTSAMWTMISVMATILVGLLSAVLWLIVKLLHL